MDVHFERVFTALIVLAVLAGIAGIVMLFIAPVRLVGLLLLVIGVAVVIGALPGASMVAKTPLDQLGRAMVVSMLSLVGVGVCLPLGALTGLGLLERNSAPYALAYGDAVNVRLPESCVETFNRRPGENPTIITCDNATWTVGGRTVTGELYVGESDLKLGKDLKITAQEVEARAHGTNAFTEAGGERGFDAPLGRWPDWIIYLLAPGLLGFIPLGLAVKWTPAPAASR